MKTRVLWLLIAICLLLGIGSFLYLANLHPTITEVDFNTNINRLILALEKGWPEITATAISGEGEYDGMEYTVLNADGEVLYQTREGLSVSLSQASANYDVIRDITVDGSMVGRLLIHNASLEVLQSRYRTRGSAGRCSGRHASRHPTSRAP